MSKLPLFHRTRISSAIGTLPRPPPLQPSLEDLRNLYHRLPTELLSVAQSSSALSSAVADALGVRAVILTSNVATSDLPKWITALAPFVKAVSFFDVEALNNWRVFFGETSRLDAKLDNPSSRFKPAGWLANVGPALNAIASPLVALRTLDITEIPFKYANFDNNKAFRKALVRALASNKDSLREVAVPLTEICASALREVPLPYLEMLQLSSPIDYLTDGWTGCGIIDVLKALEAHNGQRSGESGLELRFKHVREPLRADMEEYLFLSAFCQTIRTLEIQNWSWDAEDEEDRIASFTMLFSRIKCFRWNGRVTAKIIRTIMATCSDLTELHLFGAESCHDENMTELLQVFETVAGKLRSLRMKGEISEKLVRSLGQTNPRLQTFSAEIGPDNVAALCPLLATYCRELRSLDLGIFNPDEDQQRCLRSEGWRSFAQAVQSASDELRDVVVDCGSEHDPAEPDVNDLVHSIALVLESLKDRARIVKFHVLAEVGEYRVMIRALCRLLEVATTNCRNLEEISFRFHVGDADLMWHSDEEKQVECLKLLRARKQLKNAAPHLHCLHLNGFDQEAEEILRGVE